MLNPEQVQKYSVIYNKLVNQILTYLRNNKLKTMVLGISGGIDSSVVAALCYGVYEKSNGEFHLHGVALPSLTNETVENEAAREIMESFCQHYMTVNIDDAVESLVDMCNSSMLEMTHLAKGNIKARTRMIYLYNLAQLTHGIVMGGANKTEFHLGFWTIHGSDANDVAPIINLWKTEVYELAEYIKEYKVQNEKQKHALGLSMSLTPTDGNGVVPGGDMAQIAPGYTYNEVDQVCKYLNNLENGGYRGENLLMFSIENRLMEICQEQCKHIMDPDSIKKVCYRWFNNKYKINIPITFK